MQQQVNTPWGLPDKLFNLTGNGNLVWVKTLSGGGLGIKNCKKPADGLAGVVKCGDYTWFDDRTNWAAAALYSSAIIDSLCTLFQIPAKKLHKTAMQICSRVYPAWMIENGYSPLNAELEKWLTEAERIKHEGKDIMIVRNYLIRVS